MVNAEIVEKIKKLEKAAERLEFSFDERKQLNNTVLGYTNHFLDNIKESKGYFHDDKDSNPFLQYDLNNAPISLDKIMELVHDNLALSGTNGASGGHVGYVAGGSLYPAAIGDYLAAILNCYSGAYYGHPGSVKLEGQLIRWMCDKMGYPKTAFGNLASGGSVASLIAITTARDAKNIHSKIVDTAVVYMTEQLHACIQKCLNIAGLREAVTRFIPMDNRFRMDAEMLQKQIIADKKEGLRPFLIVASAGTTDTGAIDPLEKLGAIAAAHQIWFHVDAAYGGFFKLSDEFKDKFKGIELSDSLVVDPHKSFFIPYGLGTVLVKDVKAMYRTHSSFGNYMQDTIVDTDEINPFSVSPELSRHFRGLRMWLSIQLIGIAPFKAALEEKVYLCRYFYEKVQRLGFEVGPYPELSVMIFRYVPTETDANTFNNHLRSLIIEDGRIFLSTTTIDGIYWIRFAPLSFRTHLYHADLLLELLAEKLERLRHNEIIN